MKSVPSAFVVSQYVPSNTLGEETGLSNYSAVQRLDDNAEEQLEFEGLRLQSQSVERDFGE